MVTVDYYQKLTRLLELYLLKQTSSKLPGVGYKLIALMPVDPNSWVDQQTLLLSLPELATKSRRQLIHNLFVLLKQGLSEEEYLAIYNIDLISEDSFPVKRLSDWEPQRTDTILSIPISVIGGVSSQTITVIRSKTLEKLTYSTPISVYHRHGEVIEGTMVKIEQTEADAQLTFETEAGFQNCLFTEIERVKE